MNFDLFLGLGLGASMTATAVFLSLKALERRQPNQSPVFAQTQPLPTSEIDEDEAGHGSFMVRTEEDEFNGQWKSLPGNTLELGVTGFQIRLETHGERPFHPFKLITPEGRCILDGAEGSLSDVQKLGESMAIDRGCFSYAPQPDSIRSSVPQVADNL